MKPDDYVCYCFHVPLGKLVNFARRTKPRVASQMSECLGAGTGCGWCIPMLEKIVAATQADREPDLNINPEKYAAGRDAYRRAKQETTPPEDQEPA